MKNQIVNIALAIAFSTVFLTSCRSSAEKEAAAQASVMDAEQNLADVQKDTLEKAVKVAEADEWIAFKLEQENKIRDNDKRIAELKTKLKKPGKLLDPIYEKRIDNLREKNAEMKARITNYENSQTDWAKFKAEFNRDMDELGSSLKDFSVDNKK